MRKMKTFYIAEHGNKERAYREALRRDGWRQVSDPRLAAVSLFDSDGTDMRNARIEAASKNKIPCIIYPHAAHAPFWYDCGYPWSEKVAANIVMAPGHEELLKKIGYTRPVHTLGWSYSEIKPFRAARQVKKILFAPRHANGNGWLADIDRINNNTAFMTLWNVCQAYDMQLTVRYLGSLQTIGVPADKKGVKYVRGFPDLSFKDMDEADVVVSTQTYAYMAIARGKPTVMYAEYVAPHYGNTPETNRFAAGWDNYKEPFVYPFDLFKGEPYDVLSGAAEDGECIREWKRLNIGEPFNQNGFLQLVEKLTMR